LLRGVQEPVPLFPEFYIFALKQATAMAIMGVKAITSFPISTCGVPVLLCLFAKKKKIHCLRRGQGSNLRGRSHEMPDPDWNSSLTH
jgi:hypothetical protein